MPHLIKLDHDKSRGQLVNELSDIRRQLEAKEEQCQEQIQKISRLESLETELRRSEARYRMLHESMRDAFVLVAMDGRILEFNDLYCEMLGYTPEELRTITYLDLTPQRWHDFEAGIVESQIIHRGFSDVYEKEYRRKDGTVFPVELRTILSRDEDGKTNGMWATVRDITKRKRAEAAIRKAEALARERFDELNQIYHYAPVGLFTMDRQYRFTRINEHLAGINGFPAEYHIGKSIDEIVPDLADHLREVFRPVLENGETLIGVELQGETPKQPGIRRHGLASFFPLRSAEQTVIGLSGAVIEVTDWKRAEEELQIAYSRLQTLFDHRIGGLGIAISNEKGDVLHANDYLLNLFGCTRDELLSGRVDWRSLTPPKWLVADEKALKQLNETGAYDIFEKEYAHHDGSCVPVLITGVRMPGEGGEILSFVLDITERKQAEEALNQLNLTLEKQVAERTSELRRRTAELRELAYKTIQAMESDRKALSKEFHDSIGGTLGALLYMIQARLETMSQGPPPGKIPFERVSTHLQKAIKEVRRISARLRPSVLDDFGLEAGVRDAARKFNEFYPHIAVVYKVALKEQSVPDDIQTVIYRVLQEALNNIGKHSKADHVDIRCCCCKGRVHLDVRDDGIGFDCREVSNLTHSFGLISMRERVEICKGRFRVKSAPGKGTVIKASIPLQADIAIEKHPLLLPNDENGYK